MGSQGEDALRETCSTMFGSDGSGGESTSRPTTMGSSSSRPATS